MCGSDLWFLKWGFKKLEIPLTINWLSLLDKIELNKYITPI